MKLYLLGLLAGCMMGSLEGGCWKPSAAIEHLCEAAAENVAPGARRLLWHGGGAEALDIPDHNIGDGQRYRGDGGTLHDYEISGDFGKEPGSTDSGLVTGAEFEIRFFNFVEGRAKRGETTVFGQEDGWWRDLLKCTEKIDEQMCQRCGAHCSPWNWEASGYAILNATELEIEDLFWMSEDTYISKEVILPLSVCVQYDWWLCARRLDENTVDTAI